MKTLDAALLQALRASPIYVPATELAAHAQTTRDDVWTRIDSLRQAGFEIDERPGLGYRLVSAPDRLIADDLLSRLENCALIRDILVFEETDSTNDRARQLGRSGAANGLAIFAERQTAGRGRFGRRWESASHLGLWFSLLLRPTFPMKHWPRLTTWAAVSIAVALERTAGVTTGIKWPNDVYLGSRKVAGVLIEAGEDPANEDFAVVGLGVNVNHAPENFPAELSSKATSLRLATGRTIDRPALAAAILRELDARFADIDRRFEKLVAEASQRSVLLGHWVQVRRGESISEGMAEALAADGELMLRTADAALYKLSAGEVTVVGSAALRDSGVED